MSPITARIGLSGGLFVGAASRVWGRGGGGLHVFGPPYDEQPMFSSCRAATLVVVVDLQEGCP